MTGWRSLRSDGASGVEVAIVAEEFGRGLVDAPFLGPVLADDLTRQVGSDGPGATVAVDGRGIDARGYQRALALDGTTVLAADLGDAREAVDLTRATADIVGTPSAVGELELRRRRNGGWRSRWRPRRRTWSERPEVRTPWRASTRKSVSSTAIRSAPIRPSRICSPKAWR